jgi:hypothetical protein
MKRDALWASALILAVVLGSWSQGRGVQPGLPLTDERFCSDSNGDGRLDVSDAVTVLQYLFQGTSTPYCVAQEVGLEEFANSSALLALTERVATLEAASRKAASIASGSYIGDGTNGRVIETGLTGTVRSVRIWVDLVDCGNERGLHCVTNHMEKTHSMPPGVAQGWGRVEMSGPNFVVDRLWELFPRFDSGGPNDSGLVYHWVAFADPASP